MNQHTERILDQFTRQAIPFATSPSMSNEETLRMLVDFSGVAGADTVLDVACGPGLVAAAFAQRAKRIVGIDLTPAMVDRAKEHCTGRGLVNVHFQPGDALHLPFADESFSLVLSRYAFHHLEQPQAAMAEMARVCAGGGRILLVDAVASDDPGKAAAFNAVERIRDPSHVEFRPVAELTRIPASAGLRILAVRAFPSPAELEGVLARSFPEPGGAQRIREAYAQAVADDAFGVGLYRKDNALRFAYPSVALLIQKP
jgi:SAM-dependent methyltransferase